MYETTTVKLRCILQAITVIIQLLRSYYNIKTLTLVPEAISMKNHYKKYFTIGFNIQGLVNI
jgi:hypothetical protein